MEEFNTINEIISETVRDSSYITVLISSSVFIIYTLIVKLVDLFKSKNKNKPLLEMASAIKEIGENVARLNQVLDKTIKDSVAKELSRVNNIIDIGFNSFKSEILNRCIDIIIYNNIDKNKDNIKQSLYKTINTEYYKLYSIFSEYEHDSVKLATKLKEEWIDELLKIILDIIYNGSDSANRIRQLNNKLDINIEEYSIYVTNKILNN